VTEFEDQEAARVAARAALEALFDADLDEERAKDSAAAETDAKAPEGERATASAVSRRGLLTGKIASEKGVV